MGSHCMILEQRYDMVWCTFKITFILEFSVVEKNVEALSI